MGDPNSVLLEIEAVFAVEVAHRPDGLGHDVDTPADAYWSRRVIMLPPGLFRVCHLFIYNP